MSITLDGTLGVTSPTYGGTVTAEYSVPVTGFKNRIINGACMIDQRNAGASVTPTNAQYLIDRWQAGVSAASKFSVQQNAGSVTPPVGFKNYLGCTSLSAYAVGASDSFRVQQAIEGFNVADLAWGTANAQSVTISFKAYSSLTGTFGGSVYNVSGTRSYPFSYSIPVANTWTTISVTIPGDTIGTWPTDNTAGLYVAFSLGAGSTYSSTAGSWASGYYLSATGATSVVGTNGATFYVTGVQLEKGSTATSFDYRPYGTELQLCQRYCYAANPQGAYSPYGSGQAISTTVARIIFQPAVTMRATSTSITYSGTLGLINANDGSIALTGLVVQDPGVSAMTLGATVASGLVAGNATRLLNINDTSGKVIISAEL